MLYFRSEWYNIKRQKKNTKTGRRGKNKHNKNSSRRRRFEFRRLQICNKKLRQEAGPVHYGAHTGYSICPLHILHSICCFYSSVYFVFAASIWWKKSISCNGSGWDHGVRGVRRAPKADPLDPSPKAMPVASASVRLQSGGRVEVCRAPFHLHTYPVRTYL